MKITDASEFLKLAGDIDIIDVRSPSEFLDGHIPGAHNLPLFNDEERAIVGTLYKNSGREASVLRGLELVGPKLSDFVKQARKISPNHQLLVHCWRGAERAGFASALILALEKDLPLKKLKEQFSLRYGVLFPKNSIGGLFFNEYEKWLGSVHKLHSGKRLSAFIQDHYVDSTGNMKFYIDSASGVVFDSNKKAVIKKVPKKISIGGWAIDAKQFIVVEDLFLKIDGRKKVKVIYKTKRPDVIKFLGLADHKKYPEKVGWEAVLNSSDVPQGCQKLYFEFDYHGIRRIDFFTGFELCIE